MEKSRKWFKLLFKLVPSQEHMPKASPEVKSTYNTIKQTDQAKGGGVSARFPGDFSAIDI